MVFAVEILSCVPSFYLLSIIVLVLGLYRWYKRPRNFPPGPRGVPFLGAIPFLGNHPERTIERWSKQYGPIVAVRLGPFEMVVLNDFTSVHQAFVKQQEEFSGRPHFIMGDVITENKGIAMLEGEEWKSQRKFGLMTLRSHGMGKQGLENKILEETSYYMNEIRMKNGNAFDPKILTHNTVSNVICHLCFGRRFEYDDPKFTRMMELIVNNDQDPVLNIMITIINFAPFLHKLPVFSYYFNKVKKTFSDIMEFLSGVIEEHQKSFDSENMRDFIDSFLVEMKKDTNAFYTLKQLKQYLRDLFQAGTETTSNTLLWAFLVLLHHPQIQEKLRKEIHYKIGDSGKVSWSKRSDMPYTCAFIEEMLRYRPLIPLGVQHAASRDAKIGNYMITKGTTICANIWAVHNDEKIWEKPEVFNPERFINNKGEFVRSQYVIPFSVGPRHCLGEQLARMELFIVLVSLVQKFEFLPDPDSFDLPAIKEGTSGMIFTPKHFKLVIKEL